MVVRELLSLKGLEDCGEDCGIRGGIRGGKDLEDCGIRGGIRGGKDLEGLEADGADVLAIKHPVHSEHTDSPRGFGVLLQFEYDFLFQFANINRPSTTLRSTLCTTSCTTGITITTTRQRGASVDVMEFPGVPRGVSVLSRCKFGLFCFKLGLTLIDP